MIIDGKKIAEEIKIELKEKVAKSGRKWKLAIILVGDNEASRAFIEQKKKFAKEIGVGVRIYNLPADIATHKLRAKLSEICKIKQNNGVIVQLPLPKQIDAPYVLNAIPPQKDPDCLSSRATGDFVVGHSKILPPTVAAVKIIFDKNDFKAKGKYAVVVGRGALVGRPVANWLINEGATVSVLNSSTSDIAHFLKDADIVVSGTGKANLIKPDMIKSGAVLIDIGFARNELGKLCGDIDHAVAEKAAIFSPVPGGIGPITVALLFKNLIELAGK